MSVVFGPRFNALKQKSSKNIVTNCFLMIRRVDICRKTLFLELIMWSKLTFEKHIFFKAIFRNRHFVSTGALFAEVPGAKKLRKNCDFSSIFYVWVMGVFDG